MSESLLEFERLPEEGYVIRIRPPRLLRIPDPTREHLANAQKELLLAFRGLIDAAIEGVEEAAKPKGRTRKRIEVQ